MDLSCVFLSAHLWSLLAAPTHASCASGAVPHRAPLQHRAPGAVPHCAPLQRHCAPQVLCDIVLDNPNSAEAWFNFLDNEELCMGQGGSAPPGAAAEHRDADAATSVKAGGVG
eukprot:scaffold70476_cov15-Tisochrysis_lutea.AAC.1